MPLASIIKYSFLGGLLYIVVLIEMESLRGLMMDTEVWYAFLACFVLVCLFLDWGEDTEEGETETIEVEVK